VPLVIPLFASLLLSVSVRCGLAQEIWFGPRSDLPDFMTLFRSDAPWTAAASHVSVVEISDHFAQTAPASDMVQIGTDVHTRGIDLAVGVLALPGRGPGWCGYQVEGYSAPGGPRALADRLKAIGVTPKYFSMDEPLYFGHAFVRQGGRLGCQRSVAELAKDVGENVRRVRDVFPHARFGDVEPALALRLNEIEEWLDSFEKNAGTKLAFFRVDMDWKRTWKLDLPALSDLLRRKGVQLQVIYNGNGSEHTDQGWLTDAKAHFVAFESNFPQLANAVMIQSWNPHPGRILPDSDPDTLTSLINVYVAWRNSH
jgi:hypothetical protein